MFYFVIILVFSSRPCGFDTHINAKVVPKMAVLLNCHQTDMMAQNKYAHCESGHIKVTFYVIPVYFKR